MSILPPTFSNSHHPLYQQQQQQLSFCQEQQLKMLLQSFYGSNASVREAAQRAFHEKCDDILPSVPDGSRYLDDVTDTDLHAPDNGLALYAFATPFILIIGNCSIVFYTVNRTYRTRHTSKIIYKT